MIAHLITDHMEEEGVKIQWSRVPQEIRQLSSLKLEVHSQTTEGKMRLPEEYDTVLLAIGKKIGMYDSE